MAHQLDTHEELLRTCAHICHYLFLKSARPLPQRPEPGLHCHKPLAQCVPQLGGATPSSVVNMVSSRPQ